MLRTSSATFALLLAVAPATGQEASGTVEGTLALEEVRWIVAPGGDDGPTSAWQEADRGYAVQIAAFPTREAERSQDALVIRFVAEGAPGAFEAIEPSVTLLRPEEDRPLRSLPVNTDLTLAVAQREGDELVVSGSLHGRMTPGGEGEIEADLEGLTTVDASFQATIERRGEGDETGE
jgi:hypothetical protein